MKNFIKYILSSAFIFCISLFSIDKANAQVVQNIFVAEGIEENRIYWDPYFNATAYTVYWSTSPGAYPNGSQVNIGNQNTYFHANITAGQKYYYSIVATVAGQVSTPPSPEVSGTPAATFISGGSEDGYAMYSSCMIDLNGTGIAAAPAGVTVNTSISQNMIYWNPIGGAVSYDVKRSTVSGGPYTNVSTNNTNIYFIDNTVTNLTTYYYVVSANFGPGCTGGTSSEVSATTTAPFDSIGGGSEDGYAMNTSCMIDLNGVSIAAAPAGVTANASISQNMIYWQNLGGAISYNVQRSTVSGGPYSNVSTNNTNIYFIDNSATPLTTYYYVVQANFSGGCPGGISSEVSVTTVAAFDSIGGGSEDGYNMSSSCMIDLNGGGIAAAPAGLTVNASISQNMIYWNPIGGAVSYDVQRSTNSGGPYANVSTNNTNIYFVDNSVTPLTTYYYVVSANFGVGCTGGTSAEVSATTVAPFDSLGGGSEDGYNMNSSCMIDLNGVGIAAAPAGLTVNPSISQNMIYWNPIGGAVSYNVQRSTNTGGPYSNVSSNNTNIYFVDNSVTPLTTYYYVVSANFGVGCTGGTSSEVSATTVAPFDSIGGGSADGYDMYTSCYLITLDGKGQVAVASSGSNTFCLGDSIILTSAGANSYLWSNGETTQSISVKQAGTYTVSTVISGCTGTSSPIQINVNNFGNVTATSTINKICPGDSVTLRATGMLTYSWSPVQSLNTATGDSVSAKPALTTLYTLTGTDGNGCQAKDTISIQVVQLQAPLITSNVNTNLCIGDSAVLTSSPANTYTWSTGETTASITVKNAGSYDVSIQDATGCKNTSLPTSIVVNPLPSVNITPSGNTTFCQGDSVILNANSGTAYLWNNGETSQSIKVKTSGTYSVLLIDVNLCSDTSSAQNVIVNSLPSNSVNVSGALVFCQGDSVILSADTAISQYLWSNGETSQKITVKQSGSFTVQLTDTNNCKSVSAIQNVTSNNLPDTLIVLSGSSTLCQGDSVILSAQNNQTYNWSNGETTQSITVKQSGTFSVVLQNAAACIDSSSSYQILVNPKPSNAIVITGSLTLCQGDTATLTASSGNTYLWSNGETTQSIDVTQAGTFTVQLSSAANCTDVSLPLISTLHPLPSSSVQISGALTFCQGDSVSLSADPGLTYQWSNGETSQSVNIKQSGNYSVVVTDINACSSTSNTTAVQVHNLPSTQITQSGSLTFCIGDSVLLSAQPNLSYLWNTGETTQSIEVSQSGNYWVFLTNTDLCSDTSATSIVQVNSKPPTQITASGSLSFCQGDSVILSAPAGYNYVWSGGQSTQSITITQSGNYSVFVTDNSSCNDTSTIVSVKVNALPVSSISANGPLNFCQGDSVILSATKAKSYLWSDGSTTQNIKVTQSGNYTVRITDSVSCSSISNPIVVQVNALPTAGITANGPLTFCQGDSVILSADNNVSYLWSNGETGRSITVKSSGNYSVLVTNSSNCSLSSNPILVNVKTLPSATITPSSSTSFCQGDSVVLNSSVGSSYIWSNSETTQSIVVKSTGNYYVNVSGANGCSSTSSVLNITANSLPSAIITPNGNITLCQGDTLTLKSGAATSWIWSNGESTQNIKVTNPGDYSVTLTDINNCNATSSIVQVSVVSKPSATISASGALIFCADTSVTLTSSPAQSYAWSNGASTKSITINTSGNYDVTVSDTNNCKTKSAPIAVIVHPLPAATITASGPTTFCPGGNVVLTASTGKSWLWSNGASTQTVTVTSSASLSVVVTNNQGCSSTSSVTNVTVLPSMTATISASGPLTFCKGNKVTLSANAGTSYLWSDGSTTQNIEVSASGSYTVVVTAPTGCYASSQPTVVTVNDLPNPIITLNGSSTFCEGDSILLSTGNYNSYTWSDGSTTQSIYADKTSNYSVSVKDNNGCSNVSQVVSILVNPKPSASISANGPLAFCQGGSVTLSSSTGVSYLWSNGSSSQNVNASYSGTYSVTVSDANSCTASASIQVVVYPLPALPLITANGYQLSTSTANSYQWNLNNNPITGATNQTYTATASGNYTVTITDGNSCSNTSDPKYLNVIGIEELYLSGEITVYPNPFSHNTHLKYTLIKNCEISIELYSILGNKITSLIANARQTPGEYEFSLGYDLAQGVYFIQIRTNGMMKMIRVVKTD